MQKPLDDTDRKLLAMLVTNGRTPNVDLARELRIAPSASFKRLRRLEDDGIIKSYHARLDSEATGASFLAFVMIRTSGQAGVLEIAKALQREPAILEVHQTAGDDCFLVKTRTAGTQEFTKLLNERIAKIKGVAGTKTVIALGTFKEEMSIAPELLAGGIRR